MRGKRGLNHVHVGSLHAADAEMALHNARDLYTRRNEGVSIWVVRADDITASSPAEKDPFFAPGGRQGLPPPDVLRDPRGRAAPVTDDLIRTPTELDEPIDHDDQSLGPIGTTTAWAFGTGFEDVPGRDHRARPGRRRPGRPRAVLPHARRRRADLRPAPLRVGQRTPRSWRRRSRWPTPRSTCSARPGCCWRAPRTSRARARDEDALAYLRRRGGVPQRRARRARPTTSTSPARSPACCCSRPGGSRCCTGCSTRATRCSPRSRARASRSWPTTATTPRAGRCGSATAPTESHRRMQAALDAVWPYVDELFRTSDVERRLAAAGVAVDPAETRDEVDAVLDQVLAARHADPPARPPVRHDRRPRRAAGRAHRAPRATCSRRCRAWPASTRARRGEPRATRAGARAVVAPVVDPEMPMLTLDDLGVVRGVGADGDARHRDDHADLLRLPGPRGDARRPARRADRRRVRGASRCARCCRRRGAPTGSPTRAARKLAEHGIAPPGAHRPARRRADPADPRPRRPPRCAARAAGRPPPRSCPASARPPAPRCAAARPAASRSST